MDSALPPPTPPVIDSGRKPPGRLALFVQVWWRSIVLAIVGGAVVGVVVVVPLALFADDTVFSDVGWAAYFGAIVGFVLGVVAGVVLGAVAAVSLTPYRGDQRTLIVTRVLATVLVGGLLGLLLLGASVSWLAVVLVLVAIAGAWVTSPFAVNWYIRRMEASE